MADETNGMAGLTNAKKHPEKAKQEKPALVQESISEPPHPAEGEKQVKRVSYLTRWNLFAIGMVLLFSFLLVFTGICIHVPNTAAGETTIVSVKNPLNLLRQFLGWPAIHAPLTYQVANILIAVYLALFTFAFIFEYRYAIVKHKKVFSLKMVGIYLATLVLCVALSFGLGLVIQSPYSPENIGACIQFLGEALGITAIIYLFIGVIIVAILLVVVNFIRRDKPLNLSNDALEEEEEDHDIGAALGADDKKNGAGNASLEGTGNLEGAGGAGAIATEELAERELVFPALSRLDKEYGGVAQGKIKTDDISLIELCNRFRNYLCKTEKLYYDIDTIRVFISGMAASHLEILEGLSGTGKSSLPRYFARFVGGEVIFLPVQATWRDKSSLLGYFNDFSKTYRETDFLLNLYAASYNPDKLYMFVLDEMNISRIEYYFADFLSVLEYPEPEWKIRLMQLPTGFVPPVYLDRGFVTIPNNSYFIGTANQDDSTFSIADKVYDRAITIAFSQSNTPFTPEGAASAIHLSASKFHALLKEAVESPSLAFTPADAKKFGALTSYVYEEFGVAIGNRILHQIEIIVPAFLGCGGKKDDILDFIFARKVVAKLEGRFEEYVKSGLERLLALIDETFGPGAFPRSSAYIATLIKRL